MPAPGRRVSGDLATVSLTDFTPLGNPTSEARNSGAVGQRFESSVARPIRRKSAANRDAGTAQTADGSPHEDHPGDRAACAPSAPSTMDCLQTPQESARRGDRVLSSTSAVRCAESDGLDGGCDAPVEPNLMAIGGSQVEWARHGKRIGKSSHHFCKVRSPRRSQTATYALRSIARLSARAASRSSATRRSQAIFSTCVRGW